MLTAAETAITAVAVILGGHMVERAGPFIRPFAYICGSSPLDATPFLLLMQS